MHINKLFFFFFNHSQQILTSPQAGDGQGQGRAWGTVCGLVGIVLHNSYKAELKAMPPIYRSMYALIVTSGR